MSHHDMIIIISSLLCQHGLVLGRYNLVCFGMGMVCLKGDKEPDTSTFPDMVTELLYSARIFSLMKEGTNRKKKYLCQECTMKPHAAAFVVRGKGGTAYISMYSSAEKPLPTQNLSGL